MRTLLEILVALEKQWIFQVLLPCLSIYVLKAIVKAYLEIRVIPFQTHTFPAESTRETGLSEFGTGVNLHVD